MNTVEKKFPLDASGGLLDHLTAITGATDDRDLSKKLGLHMSSISRIRNGWISVNPYHMDSINRATGVSLEVQRALVGDAKAMPRTHVRQKDRSLDMSGNLFEYLHKHFKVTTDSAMAKKAGISLSNANNIRRGRAKVGDIVLMKIHNSTGISIKKLRELIAQVKP